MKRLLFVSSLLLAVAAACGGDASDVTGSEITDAQLVAMVLPQEDFGPAYAGFDLSEDESGFRSNEDVLKFAFDEEKERERNERLGRLNGYAQVYVLDEALVEGDGLFSVRTIVSLFQDANGASGHLSGATEDAKDAEGITTEGVTLQAVDPFEPEEIADGANGLVLTSTVDADDVTFRQTSLVFHRGRLEGAVTFLHLDGDMQAEVERVARKLDQRIAAVLRGEIEP